MLASIRPPVSVCLSVCMCVCVCVCVRGWVGARREREKFSFAFAQSCTLISVSLPARLSAYLSACLSARVNTEESNRSGGKVTAFHHTLSAVINTNRPLTS